MKYKKNISIFVCILTKISFIVYTGNVESGIAINNR